MSIDTPYRTVYDHEEDMLPGLASPQDTTLEGVLASRLVPKVAAMIELKQLQGSEQFIEEIVSRTSPTLTIKMENFDTGVTIDKCHCVFKDVLKHLQTKEPVFLTGPAGSGKSTIAEQVAQGLQMEFGSISVCAQTTKTDFLGYMDVSGNYCSTLFRKIYEWGGIFLIDEIDAGNPNVLAVLNAALSGNQFAFPDRVVTKNQNFLLVATANTLGKGSTEYVGRNQLDVATLDRFNFIHVNYDEKLERMLIPKNFNPTFNQIKRLRAFVLDNKIGIIVSTRSIVKIYKLMESGFEFSTALNATILKCTDDDTKKTIFQEMKKWA